MLLIEKIAKEIEGPDTDDYLLSKAVSEKYLQYCKQKSTKRNLAFGHSGKLMKARKIVHTYVITRVSVSIYKKNQCSTMFGYSEQNDNEFRWFVNLHDF